MKNKKASHVGVVLSFVIFVTFAFFLYTAIEPTIKLDRNKEQIVNNLETSIKNRISNSLVTITIGVNQTYNAEDKYNCLNFTNPSEFRNMSLIVKDANNKPINFKNDSENFVINWTDRSKRFFKLYYSNTSFNEFSSLPSSLNCTSPEENKNYSKGLIKKEENIFEEEIIELLNNYNTSYDLLKQELLVPQGSNFFIKFIYDNGTTISLQETNVPKEVYVKEIRVLYINKDANIVSGTINIKVW